jgi:hypothetical protein
MTVAQLEASANLTRLNNLYDKEIIASLVTDFVSEKLKDEQAGSIWITDRTDAALITEAKTLKIAAIIITKGQTVANSVINAANEARITLFSSPLPAPDLVGELYALGIRIDPYGQPSGQTPGSGVGEIPHKPSRG